MHPTARIALAVLISCCAAAPVCGQQTTLTGLGFLATGAQSSGEGISADGSTVVGYSATGVGFQAFRWTAATGMTGLGALPGSPNLSFGAAVSANGGIAVGRSGQAFVAAGSALQSMGSLQTNSYSAATAVSADGGWAAGYTDSPNGVRAFLWSVPTGMVSLGSLQTVGGTSYAFGISAEAGVVVGQSSTDSGTTRAFRWTLDTGMVSLGALADAGDSRANATDGPGTVIVGASSTPTGQRAFRWTATGGMVSLGSLTGSSEARAVSADGSAIVGQSDSLDGNGAFLYTEADGMRSLKSLLAAGGVDSTGWIFQDARGVSGNAADGYNITGYGIRNAQSEAFLISNLRIAPVPEPGAAGAIAAAVWLSLRGRKRPPPATEPAI